MMKRKFGRSRWAERTIRSGGEVLFYGRRYRVAPQSYSNGQDPPYDGSLDGHRALFYAYCPDASPGLADSVFLHSCPIITASNVDDDDHQLNVMADGLIAWMRGKEVPQ